MLAVLLNVELLPPGERRMASTVGVPSVAVNGQVIFYTGNWYAAISADCGRTFRYVDPFTTFAAADPPNSHFSCNQVVHYISHIDTFVWLLQYGPDTASNRLRLAFAKTQNVASGQWHTFDITPETLGLKDANLDHPDLAVGANFLYVTTNIFTEHQISVGAAIVRIPFDSIDSGRPTGQTFVSSEINSFRVAQDCGTTAFFAAHETTSTLHFGSWEEGQGTPKLTSVPVASWIGGSGYKSETPDGRHWLDRIDPRITGATLAADELWFAWTVDRGTDQRPNPFVRIARISTRDFKLIDNVSVFDAHSAISYPALSTNEAGEVGITCAIGGSHQFPSHLVGILTSPRQAILAATGDRAPVPDSKTGRGEWGTYLTVRPVFPGRKLFAATGYTLKGKRDGDNRDATPRLVIFGRSGEVASSSELGQKA
jgi:hypothetical protein